MSLRQRHCLYVAGAIVTLIASTALPTIAQDRATACSFSGPAKEQARCLLRFVEKFGDVERTPITLPAPLDRLIGESTGNTITKESFLRYLASQRINEEEVGGPLSGEVSKTTTGQQATYFIIHDTSSPALGRGEAFPPAGMDTAAWPGNNLRSYLHPTSCPERRRNPRAVCQPVAHVFINRLGLSATGHDFKQGWRSTQYEGQTTRRRGLFLAVENIQPRRLDSHGIDSEAPSPGFTDAQLDRLALVYIAASLRRGQWLIPAFHGVIDLRAGTHDDPQNFDLNKWAERLEVLLRSIQ